ncbi:MAG: DUF4124 domain-containing protein [Nitrincola lacisaponensis]|uniref:DUF4124 domain-containing protein n=1 Tax=Nitrincola lacisaponensis TaxID=267850 RepID=UPI00391AF49D
MHKPIATLMILTLSATLQAQVYRCEGPDGRAQFQSIPCNDRPSEKVEIFVPPAPASNVAPRATEAVGESAIELRRRERAEEDARLRARSQEITEQRIRQERFNDLIRDKKIAVGMNKEQVRRSWGNPCRINRTTSTSGSREQWVYCGANYRNDYVHFQGGEVTSISH